MSNIPKEKKSSKKKDSKFVKKIKQKIYAWHRIIGIITIIPVIFWTLSGLMHPFMAHFFKPTIANERLETKPIDKTQLTLSLQEVLEKNKITEFKNFRIVSFDNTSYYQVKTTKDELVYFNALTAKKLENGDQKYANWLSRYFLDDQKNTIDKTEFITEFTSQYKYVNRYLPVYKTSFNRPDGMQVYVETASSKLATYNPKSRQAYIWFFDTFHNWAFIDWIGNNSIRIVVMFLFLSIIFFSALSGIVIYGLFWKQFKKTDRLEPKKGLRKYHRQIGIWISIFTLTFAFSGAYHATTKWNPYILDKMVYEPVFETKDILTPNNILALDWNRLENTSIIALNDSVYYRCQLALAKSKYDTKPHSKSESHKKEIPKSEVVYINATTNKTTPNLDLEYAKFLALYFSDDDAKPACCEMDSNTESKPSIENIPLLETKVITDFESREYGFANKRLPVIKLGYDTPEETTYFIETSTSRLAAVIENSDRIEGYSFAIFHKFLFMDWAGKNVRDLTTVIVALAILVISVLGLIMFLKRKD
ncbi:PepSY-associated TM region [Flavobacterium fluvii]|uniref:PepSY-associated TM region n=1 Tax=Flavobacterium fluvii TaxID=468056 RepID=A0A1M5H571_9FLAO|nr:PepSY-associated TM helix domain-containing protein [Flavobacterium fluvii]SHG11058.1 PepSY-associated TM region [Flavobacterium fluvii]